MLELRPNYAEPNQRARRLAPKCCFSATRLADEERVVLAVEADSEKDVRTTLARDPWSETLLVVDSIGPWTIRLDGRRR